MKRSVTGRPMKCWSKCPHIGIHICVQHTHTWSCGWTFFPRVDSLPTWVLKVACCFLHTWVLPVFVSILYHHPSIWSHIFCSHTTIKIDAQLEICTIREYMWQRTNCNTENRLFKFVCVIRNVSTGITLICALAKREGRRPKCSFIVYTCTCVKPGNTYCTYT